MPDFLVSAATGALGPVLGKLGDLLTNEYKRYKGVRGEVKFLMQELEAMHTFLLKKSEEENPDAQDKAWMKEVRELSYDIEDSLDDFRVRVDDDSAKPDGFIDKCKNLLAKTKARRRIAKAIQDLKLQVEVVSARNARYKQISNTVVNTSKVSVDPRALAIFEDASRLVGIDQPKQEIISFLKMEDGDISSQQTKIVSIVGIGGIGKTTLANRVYEELKGQCECRVFLSVSRNPDIFGILRTILSEVTGQPYSETKTGSPEQLIRKISEFLGTKRYLVVVDDVWDVRTWETIKCALPNNSCGSVIITTTRIHDVAKACCSPYGWVYHPKPLQENHSKVLFQNRIFGPGNELLEYLEEVSNKILKKCRGLPLAIITISGLLANKARNGVHSVTEWEKVQTSIGRGLERDSNVEGMMGILSISYFDLPSHLKACLLYLSTFPEDYEIHKDRLVRLWVAEGFIPAESTCTLYESGNQSFTELINRNLILPGHINEWTGEVFSCRLHDTILDFIVCMSIEDNFVAVHGNPRLTPPPGIKVRRLSLQGKTDGDVIIHSNQNYANVRSIISFGFPCSLLGLRFLCVLDFTYCGSLLGNHHLANIGELLQLRYLSLRCTGITELVEQIGALQCLETLDIRGCNIFHLPTAIVRLKRLVNLLGPEKLNCFPSGIKNMLALEELHLAIDIKAASVCVEEIGNLTKMRHLGISFLSNSGIIDKESYVDFIKKMLSSFQRLNKLQSLDVLFLGYGEAEHDVMLDVPWCSASLRMLVLSINFMSRVPSWMKSLVNIERLVLSIKKLDQESFCILGDLPVLANLILKIVSNVEDIPLTHKRRLLISNRYGYRSLKHFCVQPVVLDKQRMQNPLNMWYLTCFRHFDGYSMGRGPSIPMLTFDAGSMPKLQELHVHFNADITISVSNGLLEFGLKHLSQLTKVECVIHGTKLNSFRVKVAIEKELGNHPKLPSFLKHQWSPTEGERSNQERLRPRRRSKPKPPSIGNLSEQQVVQEPADDAVICTSGGDVERHKTSSFTTDDNTCQSLTAELALPTDLSFTIHHEGTSPDIGRRHCQQRRQPKARQGATICGREMVQCAPIFPDGIKGASGSTPETSRVLGPRLIAAPQPPCFTFSSGSPHTEVEQQAMDCYKLSDTGAARTSDVPGPQHIAAPQHQSVVAPFFTFSSGSPPIAEGEQQAMDSYEQSQHDEQVNAFSSTFNRLSLHEDDPGSSATSVEAASSGAGDDKTSPSTTDDNTIAGQSLTAALPLPTDLSSTETGHRHGQQRRRPEARQRATIRGRELVHGAPVITSETRNKNIKYLAGDAPATSDILGPRLIAAPQQHEAFVPPHFTFGSGSSPNAEDLANAFTSAFNGLFLRDDHPGSSATAVEAASSDTGAAPTSDVPGPQHIAAPQQHATVAPFFTFSSRSPPIAETEQQAMDSYEPSQHDDNAGSSSTSVEAASSGAGSSSCK